MLTLMSYDTPFIMMPYFWFSGPLFVEWCRSEVHRKICFEDRFTFSQLFSCDTKLSSSDWNYSCIFQWTAIDFCKNSLIHCSPCVEMDSNHI